MILLTKNHHKKTLNTTKKHLFPTIIISLFFNNIVFSTKLLAWSGFDSVTSQSIEIEAGNLVREGLVIEFFDNSDQNYHYAKVLEIEYSGHNTQLTLLELEKDQDDQNLDKSIIDDEDNKNIRIFLME